MAEIQITSGGKEHVERAADTIAAIFRDDPVLRFVTGSLPEEERLLYLRPYIKILFTAASLNKGVFQEANDWSCTAVWIPPGEKLDHWATLIPAGFAGCVMKLGLGSVKRMMFDWQAQADALKRKGMPGVKKYWYLFFIGTDERARGQGLASRIIKDFQPTASRDNVPIWLEATTTHSRDIYARCGFQLVGEVVVGKDTHAANGAKAKGGPGVPAYGMVWFPPSEGQ